MSESGDEMTDEEMDALIRSLDEGSGDGASAGAASGSSATPGGDEEEEDIEAFLAGLEGEEDDAPESSTKTATAEPDPLEAEFGALAEEEDYPMEPATSDEIAAPEEETSEKDDKSSKSKKKSSKDEVRAVEKERSKALVYSLKALGWLALALPVLACWWLLGAYLSQWVSAGWLVGIVAAIATFGLPLALWRAVGRGRYRYWAAGLALLVTVGLTAPLPDAAGDSLARYGHWPSSTIAGFAGWPADSFPVQTNASMGEFVGGLLATDVASASALGSERALGEPEADDSTAAKDSASETKEPADNE